MGNKHDRETHRDWKVMYEVDDFIIDNDKNIFSPTRKQYYDNYWLHLERLFLLDQILVQRNKARKMTGVCGWARVNKQDEYYINKIRWSLPKNISDGNNLYISFCVVNGGKVNDFRRELIDMHKDEVDEVFWFDMPHNKFIRRKNILKGASK